MGIESKHRNPRPTFWGLDRDRGLHIVWYGLGFVTVGLYLIDLAYALLFVGLCFVSTGFLIYCRESDEKPSPIVTDDEMRAKLKLKMATGTESFDERSG